MWIWVAGLAPPVARRKASTAQSRYSLRPVSRSGNSSRTAGSSTWMIAIPAASRSAISSRMASANWSAVSCSGWSWRTNERASIVTGPVSMPLTGLSVRDCAYVIHSTVIGFGRRTSPYSTGGRVHREPYACTQPLWVNA